MSPYNQVNAERWDNNWGPQRHKMTNINLLHSFIMNPFPSSRFKMPNILKNLWLSRRSLFVAISWKLGRSILTLVKILTLGSNLENLRSGNSSKLGRFKNCWLKVPRMHNPAKPNVQAYWRRQIVKSGDVTLSIVFISDDF